MLTIVNTIALHSMRIMTFRHDGRGLPVARGGGLYLIMAAVLLSRLVKDLAAPAPFDVLWHLISDAAYLGLLYTVVRPTPMAAVMLTNFAGNLIMAAVYLGSESAEPNVYIVSAVVAWELTALLAVINKVVRRAQEAHQSKQKSKETQ